MRSRISLASSVLLAFWSLAAWAGTGEGLLAPVYPGAVRAPEYDSGRAQVWLSKDPPEKVSAWYREKLRKVPEQATGRHDWFPLLRQQEVARMLNSAGRDWTLAEDAGVDVRRHPLAHTGGDVVKTRSRAQPCMSDHFMTLRHLVARGVGTQADFDALCRKYAWIEDAYYRLHDPGGLRQPMDKYLLEQAEKRFAAGPRQGAADAEALGRRMQELMQQGRFEEAGKLMESFQGAHQASATLPADAWEQWVGHLERVARNAYRTMIRIHKDPLRWTARPGEEPK